MTEPADRDINSTDFNDNFTSITAACMRTALKHKSGSLDSLNYLNSKIFDSWSTGMNRLTLAFKNPLEELRYLSDYTDRSLVLARISLLFGAAQYLLFTVIDPFIAPGNQWHMLLIRIIVACWIVLILLLSYRPSFKEYFQFGIATVPVMGGLGVAAMIIFFQKPDGYHDFYVGMMIIFFYTHALLRMRFIWATLTGWLLFVIYLGAVSYVGMDTVSFINNCFFLVSTQICGMVASYALEFYARIVFRQSKDLEERRRQIKRQHDLKASELSDMRDIQLSLLPETPPCFTGYDIAARMKTAAEIGGDFYDFAITKNGKLIFAIGDATGHGAKAGALVTAIKVLFVSMTKRKDLISIIKQASYVINATGLKKLYMSLAIGRIHGNQLELVGAGMPPALVWRALTRTIEKISLNGMPLGTPAEYPYTVSKVNLCNGDMLFLMSDGLPELFNDREEMLGYESPEKLLQKYGGLSPDAFISAVEHEILNFKGNEQLHDDISLIAIKKK